MPSNGREALKYKAEKATRPPRLKAKPMAGRWQAGLKNMSAALDVAVLLKTIGVVLMGKGR